MKQNFNELTEIFKALSHPLRVKIINYLIKKNACNVSTMAEKLDIPQPAVSRHLTALKNIGIVKGIRVENQIYYRLINKTVRKMFEQL